MKVEVPGVGEVEVKIVPIEFREGKIRYIDVTRLPEELVYVETRSVERLARAIETLEIRGAPAIGVAAAYGIAMAAYNSEAKSVEELIRVVEEAGERLRRTRPTAYNLFWAIERMLRKAREYGGSSPRELVEVLVEEAERIRMEDIVANVKMGFVGAELVEDGDTILTHCNTGALATAGWGTALGVIRAAVYQGKRVRVIATETRPLLQGSRLTMWELVAEGIPSKLITDGMVGYVMKEGMVDKVFLGADRILISGHVANKIGTYTIAVLARHHGVPFYPVAPTSTIDPHSKSIPIEHRSPEEVKTVLGRIPTAPREADALNPAFDVTPPELVTAIVTEKGIVRPPFPENIRRILSS